MSPRIRKYKFWVDENVSAMFVDILRSMGHSVEDKSHRSLKGVNDLTQIRRATKSGSILLTNDIDFRTYNMSTELIKKSYGVIVLATSITEYQLVNRTVKHIIKLLEKNNIRGKIARASASEAQILP